jgi:A/G-specific adenine glycosylase
MIQEVSQFQHSLLLWYDEHARCLPWRETPSPYRVWISEIMLQQTRVETVRPYFERFIEELPTVQALAGADEQALLKLWEGLGYYSRARNLQKAARVLIEKFGGVMPSDINDLKQLPGIGPYTAGAVASIAFGVRTPAIDGNVLRVIARLTACDEDIGNRVVKTRIEGSVNELLPLTRVGTFNQALMELGATVCLPGGAPQCRVCPVREQCTGHALGIAEQLPVKAKKPTRRIEEKTVFIIICDGKIAIKQRPGKGLLAGLWELPNTSGTLTPEQCAQVLRGWGISFTKLEALEKAKHIFTHIEWLMQGYRVYVSGCGAGEALTWVTPEELTQGFVLPSAFNAFTAGIDGYLRAGGNQYKLYSDLSTRG